MECQILFSGTNKKKYFKMLSAENLPKMPSIIKKNSVKQYVSSLKKS